MRPDREAGASDSRRNERSTGARRGTPRTRRGGLLGLGLDGEDGHRRITKGDGFMLFGGSEETHERMTEIVLRMRERLKRSGRSFGQLSAREFEDLGRECL